MPCTIVVHKGTLYRFRRQPDEPMDAAAGRAWWAAHQAASGMPLPEAVCRSLMRSFHKTLGVAYDGGEGNVSRQE